MKSVTLFETLGYEIREDYEKKMSMKDLEEKYKCSYNTMMVVLGMLGFPTTPYFKKQILKKFEWMKAQKEKRTAITKTDEK